MELNQGDLGLFKNNSARYIIKFDTAKAAVDADTLANALSAYKRTVLSLASERRDSEELFVDVDVVDKGCIEIHTILTAVQSVINPETLPAIVDGIKNLVGLYRFLKGRPAKKVVAPDPAANSGANQVVITNADNATITINNTVYKTYVTSDTPPFGDSRNYARDGISSVRMLDEDKKEYVRIDRSEFESFEKGRHRVDDEDIKDIEEELELVVTNIPIGSPKNQWGFINAGEKFSAKIKDNDFIEKVDRHEITFGKGDRIRAKVSTHKEFDAALNCVVVKSRKIMRVLGYSGGKATQMSFGRMSAEAENKETTLQK